MLMLHTGLRVSEVSNLRISDISIFPRRGEIIVRSGKGEKFRAVPLNSNVRSALKAYLSVRPGVDHDHLFVGQKGEPLRLPGIYYLVKKYGYEARIEDISPHTCRHTFARKFLMNGGDLLTLQRILGHSSLDVVKLYVALTTDDILSRQRRFSPMDRVLVRA